jgi:hypothetical protein
MRSHTDRKNEEILIIDNYYWQYFAFIVDLKNDFSLCSKLSIFYETKVSFEYKKRKD